MSHLSLKARQNRSEALAVLAVRRAAGEKRGVAFAHRPAENIFC